MYRRFETPCPLHLHRRCKQKEKLGRGLSPPNFFFLLTPRVQMERTGRFETSVHKTQPPGNNIYLYKYPSNLVMFILPVFTTYENGTVKVFGNVGT